MTEGGNRGAIVALALLAATACSQVPTPEPPKTVKLPPRAVVEEPEDPEEPDFEGSLVSGTDNCFTQLSIVLPHDNVHLGEDCRREQPDPKTTRWRCEDDDGVGNIIEVVRKGEAEEGREKARFLWSMSQNGVQTSSCVYEGFVSPRRFEQDVGKSEAESPPPPTPQEAVAPRGADPEPATAMATEKEVSAKPSKDSTPAQQEPKVEKTLQGDFRGAKKPSRVLFLDNKHIVHAWDEAGEEKRVAVTTEHPPGERQCKALDSDGAQDFLVCLYWYTGPGGGRVDGMLFDLKRKIAGEFFSAAINLDLTHTLCSPQTAMGPMPAYWVDEFRIQKPKEGEPASIVVPLTREGWSTATAEQLRKTPTGKEFCACFAEGEENCPVKLEPPKKQQSLVFQLTSDQLHPTEPTVALLKEIAEQWGHSVRLMEWNMKMRGF